ncbi:GNAT family N-acetyltransferase [Ectobacillus ponti]|uniref:GNAT family N-acetyltransferase n=1 Tax=Ectobacillus ponti TaxID=2961894 RepID=A0AA41X5U3_9BACI|nr:GNAT family N-acetyltransferase [Ectobacillus ponti]MCP8969479.1 GNAT family N-acetyltransferase [Ectobacillus ponti]
MKMKKMTEQIIQPELYDLLSLAAAADKIPAIYKEYVINKNRGLYAWMENENIVGCIGIELSGAGAAEICHLAVAPSCQRKGIAGNMIRRVCRLYHLQQLTAETDADAVGFYRSCGFAVSSLGEKYPGVERFFCKYIRHKGRRRDEAAD